MSSHLHFYYPLVRYDLSSYIYWCHSLLSSTFNIHSSINYIMKEKETETKWNAGSPFSRRNSKGYFTDQYVGGKYASGDPFQDKLDLFVRAFEQVCLKLQATLDKQNNKINNLQSTLVVVLGSKLDRLVQVGQKIHEGFERNTIQLYANQSKQKKLYKPDLIPKDSVNNEKVQNSLKESIMSLNKSVPSNEVETKNNYPQLPPLPTIDKCLSPPPSGVKKKKTFSFEEVIPLKVAHPEPPQPLPSPRANHLAVPYVQKQKSEINRWIGQFYNYSAAKYFQQYSKGKLNYEDMKIKFSYDVISQSINLFQKWQEACRGRYDSKEIVTKRPQFYHMLNQASKNCLQFLISKYPPSRRKKIDTELSEKIKDTNKKFSVTKYDMLANAKMDLGLVDDQNDFTKQIKRWLNMLVMETRKQFPHFKAKMRDIFINSDSGSEGTKAMDSSLEFIIGTKISQGTALFTPEQLQAPGLQIKSTQLLRILMKWCEELSSYFTNPQDKIYGNTSGFKTIRGTLPIKIPRSRLDQLAKNLKRIYQTQILNVLKTEDTNVGHLVTDLLSFTLDGIHNYEFLNQRQISIVKLSEFLNQSLKTYVLRFLNLILSKLIKIRREYDAVRLEANIHLVTFNVMDLLRCRCVGSKKEIYRIFQAIRVSDYFDIIRVKNKLNEPTRDILINLKIKDSFLICEVQLSLGEAQQEVNDHFCHFLYQLQRTNFGVLFESSSQVCNLDPRIQYILKHKDIQFKGAPQKKMALIQNIKPRNDGPVCQCSSKQILMEQCPNDRPFCCSLCTSFQAGYTICLPYYNCKVCCVSICPQCIIMISKNNSSFMETYTSKGSHFYELMRFFYPQHLFEEVGNTSTTQAKIPDELTKYPYILHMVVDNIGHKPVLYKRYKKSFTEAFSTLEGVNMPVKASFCWNYLIALKPSQRKTISELKDYRKLCVNMEWSQLQELLKEKKIRDLVVVIDEDTKSALIADIIESDEDIENCQLRRAVENTIEQTNRLESNSLEITSKKLPNIELLSKIKNKPNIKYLNLWQNMIKNIDLLAEFTGLQELFLRQNQIEDLSPILGMKELESAFISSNKITGPLPALHLEHLTALDISVNSFSDVNKLKQSRLSNLVFFRMVNIKITELPQISLPKLEIFWFDHNQLTSLQNFMASRMPALTKISGSHNNITGTLPTFLFPKLNSIIFNHNKITSIEDFCRSKLPSLRTLSLHHNTIAGPLPELSFPSLTKLDLSYNKISSISRQVFVNSHLPQLETLDLKNNEIEGDFPLISLKSLRKLDLSNNFITNIEPFGSLRTPSLQTLLVENNRIRGSLPILRILRLKYLILSDNQITDVKNLGESKMPKLLELRLNNNKISSGIPKMYFQNLRKLELCNNAISELNFLDDIHLLPSLKKVYLMGNQPALKESIQGRKDAGVLEILNFSDPPQ